MTKLRWQTPRVWLRAGVATWLAACSWGIVLAESADTIVDDGQAPQTIENPFVTKPASEQSPASSSSSSESTPPAIAGSQFASDPPPMYRLPPVEAEPSPRPAVDVPATPDADAEVGPLPDGPSEEMLDDLDAIWSDGFESGPDPSAGAAGAKPYTPTVAELSAQLLPSVRKAYGLARHGAVYAAQAEFIQVLRRIAQAKDAAQGVDVHSRSLAAGLRALDEADDFVPQGVQLEAEMNVGIVASSHRTPVLRGNYGITRAGRSSAPAGVEDDPARNHAIRNPKSEIQAHEAIALYHQYAREHLGRAVAGEQAGSMALYGLGKVQNRLASASAGDLRHERKAMTMFQAALDAGPGNHLAANEIGVLLSRGGQPAEASAMFRRAIDVAPTSISYHNLAVVERKLGAHEQADANERYAEQLAARDRATGAVSRASGVEWVTPRELARVTPPQSLPPAIGPLAGRPQEAKTQAAGIGPPRGADRSAAGTIAHWPQKLIPSVFRR